MPSTILLDDEGRTFVSDPVKQRSIWHVISRDRVESSGATICGQLPAGGWRENTARGTELGCKRCGDRCMRKPTAEVCRFCGDGFQQKSMGRPRMACGKEDCRVAISVQNHVDMMIISAQFAAASWALANPPKAGWDAKEIRRLGVQGWSFEHRGHFGG